MYEKHSTLTFEELCWLCFHGDQNRFSGCKSDWEVEMCWLYKKVARMVSYRNGRNRSFHEPKGIPPYLSQSLQPSYIISTLPPPRSFQYPSNLIPSPWRWGQEAPPKNYNKFIILSCVITQKTIFWATPTVKTWKQYDYLSVILTESRSKCFSNSSYLRSIRKEWINTSTHTQPITRPCLQKYDKLHIVHCQTNYIILSF
jgi:hypothetical protein